MAPTPDDPAMFGWKMIVGKTTVVCHLPDREAMVRFDTSIEQFAANLQLDSMAPGVDPAVLNGK
jgi:hypothetical protein